MYEKVRSNKKNRYILNASLSYDILDWLNLTARARFDNVLTNSENKYSASTNTFWTQGSNTGYYSEGREDGGRNRVSQPDY